MRHGIDPVRYESRKADKIGNLHIDGNTYAAGPAIYGRTLTVGSSHDVIEILDEHATQVRVFPRKRRQRALGKLTPIECMTIMEPVATLAA